MVRLRRFGLSRATKLRKNGDGFIFQQKLQINPSPFCPMVEMMAAIAWKDYEQRRGYQAQGIQMAKAAGKHQGRPVDEELHKRVKELLRAGLGIRATARHANFSTTTILRIK